MDEQNIMRLICLSKNAFLSLSSWKIFNKMLKVYNRLNMLSVQPVLLIEFIYLCTLYFHYSLDETIKNYKVHYQSRERFFG